MMPVTRDPGTDRRTVTLTVTVRVNERHGIVPVTRDDSGTGSPSHWDRDGARRASASDSAAPRPRTRARSPPPAPPARGCKGADSEAAARRRPGRSVARGGGPASLRASAGSRHCQYPRVTRRPGCRIQVQVKDLQVELHFECHGLGLG
jgi:hypothetical protein